MKRDIVLLISKKFNPEKVNEFKEKDSDKTFLSPIILSINEDETKFTRGQEQLYFKALHYIKYKIHVEMEESWPDQFINLYEHVRNRIICANLGLIKKCISLTSVHLDAEALIDAGNFALIDAVDNFDPWRGFYFSTYAMNCIFRRFMRESKRSSLVHPSETDPTDILEGIPTKQKDEKLEFMKERLIKYIGKRVNGLTQQEIDILAVRFNLLDPYGKKKTLKEISSIHGISKERVRQLQNIALKKIRKAFVENDKY